MAKKPARRRAARRKKATVAEDEGEAMVVFNLRLPARMVARLDHLTDQVGLGRALRSRIARRAMAHGVDALEKNMDLLTRWEHGR